MKTTITYLDIELEVHGSYYKGFSGTHDSPPEPEAFEIDTVYHKGGDITALLEVIDDWYTLEELALESLFN